MFTTIASFLASAFINTSNYSSNSSSKLPYKLAKRKGPYSYYFINQINALNK